MHEDLWGHILGYVNSRFAASGVIATDKMRTRKTIPRILSGFGNGCIPGVDIMKPRWMHLAPDAESRRGGVQIDRWMHDNPTHLAAAFI